MCTLETRKRARCGICAGCMREDCETVSFIEIRRNLVDQEKRKRLVQSENVQVLQQVQRAHSD